MIKTFKQNNQHVPHAMQIIFTLFLVILVPTYLVNYGPQNFLWFSDIGLFITFFTLWFASPLLNSICMISIFPIESIWYIDFFTQIITGSNIFGVTTYMFDPQYSLFLRSLTLFHLVIPLIWVWYIYKWGYDQRALLWAIPLNMAIIISTYLCTNPAYNINWVFMPQQYQWPITPFTWLLCMLLAFPLCIIIPMHYILKSLTSKY